MTEDPFRPLPGARSRGETSATKAAKGEWTVLVPIPKNAPSPPAEHFKRGKPIRTWSYHDTQGRLIGYVCRFDLADGGKEFMPLTYCQSGTGRLEWRWQLWPAPRPLYGLDRLAKRPKAPVIVCEGEKAADAAAELLPDHVAVTSPNGSKAAAKADWPALAGRHVTIWPDADEAGTEYAETVKRLLAPIAATIKRIDPPKGVKEGWDAADALAEGWDRARAEALLAGADDALKPKRKRRGDGVDGEEAPRKRHKPVLLAILDRIELWHSPEKIAYATAPVGDHFENFAIRSGGFRDWLDYEFYKATRAAPSAQATEEALRIAESRARFEGAEHKVFIRIGHRDGEIYLDLCDDRRRTLRMTAAGRDIIDHAPVKFVRSDSMLALPDPVWPEPDDERSLGQHLGDDLAEVLSVATHGDLVLIVAWLLMCFHPAGPFPGLSFNGPDGSGKTSAGRMVKRIIDPDMAPDSSPPRDEVGLCAMARNSWVCAFDNVSSLPGWLEDALCRLATGGGVRGRALYTNADEFKFFLKRPLLTTGIPKLTRKGDLAARLIYITMPIISATERKTEAALEASIAERHARILGALIDVVVGILAHPDGKLSEKPRMAEFAEWIARARSTLGWSETLFAKSYKANRDDAVLGVLDDDVLGQAIVPLLDSSN
ncbi:MAG: hypothetical protein ACREFK_13280, partial [Stellaceae bacterium]